MSQISQDRGTLFRWSSSKKGKTKVPADASTLAEVAELIANSDLEVTKSAPEDEPCPPSAVRDRVMRAMVANDGPLDNRDYDHAVHIKGCAHCSEELRSMLTLGLHYLETLRSAPAPDFD